MSFSVSALRQDFPALQQQINGQALCYFDNAATTLKPRPVIEAITRYNSLDTANVHRGLHTLSARATTAYEETREKLARWFHVPAREVVYTRGTTEAINLVAQCWARPRLQAGDEILITELEHHANIVPWQMLCEQTGAKLQVLRIGDDARLRMEQLEERLSHRTKLVAISAASNALGLRLPVATISAAARKVGAKVLVDGAQLAIREPLSLPEYGVDFFCCSGHKMYGPTGTGMLWAPYDILDAMPPWMGGGDMIERVTLEATTYAEPPTRFEAGTPNIGGFIGWGAGLDYLQTLDHKAIAAHEQSLLELAERDLSTIPGLRILGRGGEKLPIVSFVLQGAHEQDIATLLDENGIAVRTGHHCAMPLMAALGVRGTVRASFSAYNTMEEIEQLGSAMQRCAKLLQS